MDDAAKAFVDTNVLLYAYDSAETVKQSIAQAMLERLWADRRGTLSTQVLQEFYYGATHKLIPPIPRTEAREIIDLYATWPVVLLHPAMILAATRLEEEHQLSFWDALIIEAARVAGADLLLTEDMQHGRVIDGIRIENPFLVVGKPADEPGMGDG